MNVAIFDFDGTLLEGNSWQVLFWNTFSSSWRNRLLLGTSLGLRQSGLMTAEALKERVLRRFEGWDAAAISSWSAAFYRRELAPRLRPRALAEMNRLRAEGFVPVLATGAFDFLIQPFVREQGIDLVVSTRMQSRDGCFTARVDGDECRGAAKLAAVQQLLSNASVDWSESCAYSDNEDDVDLLQTVGVGVFVATHRPEHLPDGVRVVSWS